jgi:hypothetical protein
LKMKLAILGLLVLTILIVRNVGAETTITVTDKGTGDGIEDATVSWNGDETPLHNTTDADGTCTLPPTWAAGEHVVLTVTADGYTTKKANDFLVSPTGILAEMSRNRGTPGLGLVGICAVVAVVAVLHLVRRQF